MGEGGGGEGMLRSVLFVLPYLEAGGTEAHVLHLLRGLKDRCRFGLLAPAGPLLPEFVALGALHREFPRLESSPLKGLSVFRHQLRLLVDELRPDVIHVHAAPELALLSRAAARRAGTPVVLTLHGFAVANPASNFKIANVMARWARVARVITVSEAERRILQAAGYPADCIRVVYNGIPDLWGQAGPPEGTDPQGDGPPREEGTATGVGRGVGIDWRARCGWPEDAPVVGAVGRLDPVKAFDVLLEAFSRLAPRGTAAGSRRGEPPRLVIVGDGSEGAALRGQAQSLGLGDRVHFAGYVANGARAPAGFDVLAVPSRHEAFGIVAIEAMAAGIPVVASSVGGLPEAVAAGDTGLIVPPDDPAALAAALQTVLDEPERARAMGRRARRRFLDKFRVEVMAEHTWNVYREVIS